MEGGAQQLGRADVSSLERSHHAPRNLVILFRRAPGGLGELGRGLGGVASRLAVLVGVLPASGICRGGSGVAGEEGLGEKWASRYTM